MSAVYGYMQSMTSRVMNDPHSPHLHLSCPKLTPRLALCCVCCVCVCMSSEFSNFIIFGRFCIAFTYDWVFTYPKSLCLVPNILVQSRVRSGQQSICQSDTSPILSAIIHNIFHSVLILIFILRGSIICRHKILE